MLPPLLWGLCAADWRNRWVPAACSLPATEFAARAFPPHMAKAAMRTGRREATVRWQAGVILHFQFLMFATAVVCLGWALAWLALPAGAAAGIGAMPKIPLGTTLPISLEH